MSNQLAVITGASSGIGYNLAKVFAENGFDLVIASSGERLDSAAEDFRALGVQVTPVQADLASFDGVAQLWGEVEKLSRPVDAAAISAGVGVGGLFAETDLEKEINLVRLNVEGTMHLAKHVVRHMIAQGKGKILITASIAGEMVARARLYMRLPRRSICPSPRASELSWKIQVLRSQRCNRGLPIPNSSIAQE